MKKQEVRDAAVNVETLRVAIEGRGIRKNDKRAMGLLHQINETLKKAWMAASPEKLAEVTDKIVDMRVDARQAGLSFDFLDKFEELIRQEQLASMESAGDKLRQDKINAYQEALDDIIGLAESGRVIHIKDRAKEVIARFQE